MNQVVTKEEIKKIRKEDLKISQEHFARLLSVSLKTIVRWEKGTAKPSGASKEALVKLKTVISDPKGKEAVIGALSTAGGIASASMIISMLFPLIAGGLLAMGLAGMGVGKIIKKFLGQDGENNKNDNKEN